MTTLSSISPRINPTVIDALELDLNEVAVIDRSILKQEFQKYVPERFILKDAVREVIDKINQAVAKQKEQTIFLSTANPLMVDGSNLSFYEQYCGVPSRPFNLTRGQFSQTWLNRILSALKSKGHIENYKLTLRTGYEITL